MGSEAIRAVDEPRSFFRAFREVLASTEPILKRELLGLLRTRKAFWITVLTVAGTGLIPLLSWPAEGSPMPFLSARDGFQAYLTILAGALFLFVPVVLGSSVTTERERGTYDLLFTAISRPSGIALGKLLASGLYFALLLALTFPMIAILYLLGGFTAVEFLGWLALLLLLIFFQAVIGLNCSFKNQKSVPAIIKAFGISAGLIILGTIGFSFILVPMIFGLIIGELFKNARIANPAQHEPPAMPRETTLHHLAPARPPEVSRTTLTRWVLDRAGPNIPDHWNPVFVATVRSGIPGSAWFRRLTFWGMGLVFFFLSLGVLLSLHQALPGMAEISPLMIPVLLIFPVVAAETLIAEREHGQGELLRSTLMTPRRIMTGKLSAALFGGLAFLIAATAIQGFWSLMLWEKPPFVNDWWSHLSGPWYLFAFCLAAAATAFSSAASGLLASAIGLQRIPSLILSCALSAGCCLGLLELATRLGGPIVAVFIFSGLALAAAVAQFEVAVAIFKRRGMRDR